MLRPREGIRADCLPAYTACSSPLARELRSLSLLLPLLSWLLLLLSLRPVACLLPHGVALGPPREVCCDRLRLRGVGVIMVDTREVVGGATEYAPSPPVSTRILLEGISLRVVCGWVATATATVACTCPGGLFSSPAGARPGCLCVCDFGAVAEACVARLVNGERGVASGSSDAGVVPLLSEALSG